MDSYLEYGDEKGYFCSKPLTCSLLIFFFTDEQCLKGMFGYDSDDSHEHEPVVCGEELNHFHHLETSRETTVYTSDTFKTDIVIETSKAKGIGTIKI